MNIDNAIIKANALFTEGKYTEALRLYDEGVKAGHTRAIFNYAYCLLMGAVHLPPLRGGGRCRLQCGGYAGHGTGHAL